MQPSNQDLPPEFPGYTNGERNIFEYFDGERRVAGDPIAVRRRLETHLGNVDKVLGLCHAADFPGLKPGESPPADWVAADPAIMAAAEARGRLVEAARDALRMAPFDPQTGQGALEQQVLDAFCEYEAYLKKKEDSTPTG